MEKKDILKIILFFAVFFVIIFFSVIGSLERSIIDDVRCGVVSDKNIVEDSTTFLFHRYGGYRIYIDFEYEFFGEIREGNKYFVVDKNTYLSYDIGDNFDVRDF